jgi:hypothetical protein
MAPRSRISPERDAQLREVLKLQADGVSRSETVRRLNLDPKLVEKWRGSGCRRALILRDEMGLPSPVRQRAGNGRALAGYWSPYART